MREVLRKLTDALGRGREQIVCQVVETRGSTPQKAGALMVVDPEGGQLGTLGGGCVEAEVKQKAIRRIGQTGAEVHTFLLDHDYAWADGLVCGGRMSILVEALRGPAPLDYFRVYQSLLEAGAGFTEAVATDPDRAGVPTGTRFLFDHEGTAAAAWPAIAGNAAINVPLVPLSARPKPAVRDGFACLPTLPRIRLVIVGAGHVGHAVANLAAQADFDVWVIDDRQQYANPERFPAAQRIVVGAIDDVLPSLEVTAQTYALIVTRGHGHDQQALYHLAPTAAPYVGLIGSRRKIRMIFEGLREAGIAESALERVTAPVGFDIGSQTVPEIAISIVAELIARRNLEPRPRGSEAQAHEPARARTRMIAAIVPAAGRSERMGRPKLILPIGETTLIARVVAALRQGGAEPVVVVTPPRDAPGAAILADEAEAAGALVVVAAERPADMRASFELGLARLAKETAPSTVLLVPADSPGVSSALVAHVVSRSRAEPQSLLIPVFRSKRGHPIALPWELAIQTRALPLGAGVNALVALNAARVVEFDVDDAGAVDDLDTPEDYERWAKDDEN